MDSNGNGTLEFDEFLRACNDYRIHTSEDEARRIFNVFDRNHDGTISFDEFIDALLGSLSDYRASLV